MSSIGKCWADGTWEPTSWVVGAWCPYTPPTPINLGFRGGAPIQDYTFLKKRRIWRDDEDFIARQLHDT